MNWIELRRRGWGLGLALLWIFLLLAATVAANFIGIHLAGGIEGWQQWLANHAGHFLAWRLLLYAGTAWGWIWMCRRVVAREPGARQRLLRTEIAAVVAIAAQEISQMTGG